MSAPIDLNDLVRRHQQLRSEVAGGALARDAAEAALAQLAVFDGAGARWQILPNGQFTRQVRPDAAAEIAAPTTFAPVPQAPAPSAPVAPTGGGLAPNGPSGWGVQPDPSNVENLFGDMLAPGLQPGFAGAPQMYPDTAPAGAFPASAGFPSQGGFHDPGMYPDPAGYDQPYDLPAPKSSPLSGLTARLSGLLAKSGSAAPAAEPAPMFGAGANPRGVSSTAPGGTSGGAVALLKANKATVVITVVAVALLAVAFGSHDKSDPTTPQAAPSSVSSAGTAPLPADGTQPSATSPLPSQPAQPLPASTPTAIAGPTVKDVKKAVAALGSGKLADVATVLNAKKGDLVTINTTALFAGYAKMNYQVKFTAASQSNGQFVSGIQLADSKGHTVARSTVTWQKDGGSWKLAAAPAFSS